MKAQSLRLTTVSMLFVIVLVPINCTNVHFYDSHINLCPIITTPTGLISFLYSIIYCTCIQRVMYLYLLNWTIGNDYILASTKGLIWKLKISIIYKFRSLISIIYYVTLVSFVYLN